MARRPERQCGTACCYFWYLSEPVAPRDSAAQPAVTSGTLVSPRTAVLQYDRTGTDAGPPQ